MAPCSIFFVLMEMKNKKNLFFFIKPVKFCDRGRDNRQRKRGNKITNNFFNSPSPTKNNRSRKLVYNNFHCWLYHDEEHGQDAWFVSAGIDLNGSVCFIFIF